MLLAFNGILASVSGLLSVKRSERRPRKFDFFPLQMPEQSYVIETEQEEDGRWIAEIVDLPGVMAYGPSQAEAIANAEALAFRVIADQIETTKIATSRVSFGTP